MYKILFFILIFASCADNTTHTQQIHLIYDLAELRGETNSLLKLKDIIPPEQYKSIADSLNYKCGIVGRKASTLELSNQDKKMIDDELKKISSQLGKY
jgi:hypothetical protein